MSYDVINYICPACGEVAHGIHDCRPKCKRCAEKGLHVCVPDVIDSLMKNDRFIAVIGGSVMWRVVERVMTGLVVSTAIVFIYKALTEHW